MRIFIDVFSDFFLCHLKSMKILYNVTIINKEIKIDRVVIIPNLFIGSKSVNEKLTNPTAVVAEVKNTGLTIIPTKLFINENGYAKLKISLAKGKKLFDKRETIKDRENKRNLDRIRKDFKNK